MANVQDSSNDGSSDDDDDDEDEEEDPMEESLVNLVGNTIKELAPAAQVLCRKQIIRTIVSCVASPRSHLRHLDWAPC